MPLLCHEYRLIDAVTMITLRHTPCHCRQCFEIIQARYCRLLSAIFAWAISLFHRTMPIFHYFFSLRRHSFAIVWVIRLSFVASYIDAVDALYAAFADS